MSRRAVKEPQDVKGIEKYRIEDDARDGIISTMRQHRVRERLASLRALFSLSQAEASALVGAARGTWSGWEAEDGNPRHSIPSAYFRGKLSNVFNLPQSLFVEE